MSESDSDSESDSEFAFHTAVVDGVEVAGVVFNPKDGLFYEFQDPETHDDYERVVCPRTGDVLTWGSDVERMFGEIMSGHVRATVPAAEWAAFRVEYIAADDPRHEEWADAWRELSHADDRFEGGVVECCECGENVWSDEAGGGNLGVTCPSCGQPSADPKIAAGTTK